MTEEEQLEEQELKRLQLAKQMSDFYGQAYGAPLPVSIMKTDTAARDNKGKTQYSYLLSMPHACKALVDVFAQGAKKYERDNWKKGGKPDAEYFDSALRHMFASWNGETHDKESGNLHAAHAIWNLMAFIELNTNGMR